MIVPIFRVCGGREARLTALKRHCCKTAGSARTAERRSSLPCVCRVVGVVKLQRLHGENPPKLQQWNAKQMHFNRNEAEESREKEHECLNNQNTVSGDFKYNFILAHLFHIIKFESGLKNGGINWYRGSL